MATQTRPISVDAPRPALRLPRLRQESLATQAYEHIKQNILSGAMQAGTPLVELELAAALGISRTPVREAIGRLRRDGLVEPLASGGNSVRALSLEEMRELFLIREALECLAMREFAVSSELEAHTETLKRLLERQRRASQRGDVDTFLAIDEEFHIAVCRLAGLHQAADLLGSLRERMRQAGLRAVAIKGRLPEVIGEHEAILHSLAGGDGARAQQALIAHLAATRKALEGATPQVLRAHS